MLYNPLGKSNIKVSQIGFGCMSLGKNDEATSIALLHKAIDSGINYFDTADLYDKGNNELLVGKALKSHRADVVIATKAGNQWREDGSGWDWNASKEYILKCAEQSLERLQTDYIDLYQLHGGTLEDPIDETIEAFELLKQQGKIRQYGISSIRPNVIREYVRRSSIISVMMQYSLLDRRPEEQMLDLLEANNISVLARGSVAQGLLIDKTSKDYLGYSANDVSKARDAIKQLESNERSPSQIAIGYVLNHPAVASAVVGIRTTQQLEEATLVQPTFTDEELKSLKEAIPANTYELHR